MTTPDTQQLGNAALGDLVLGGPAPAPDGSVALTGSIPQPNDASGTLTVADNIALTGSIPQPNDATGTLSVSGGTVPLAGDVAQPNDMAGVLSVANAVVDLLGTVGQPNDLLGTLTVAVTIALTGVINERHDIYGGLVGLPPAPAPPPVGMTEPRIQRVSILMGA